MKVISHHTLDALKNFLVASTGSIIGLKKMKKKFPFILFVLITIFPLSYGQVVNSTSLIENRSISDCIIPIDGMVIHEDVVFCYGEYLLPHGISIGANNVSLYCDDTYLIGKDAENNTGISLFLKSGVQVIKCNVFDYSKGISLLESDFNAISNNKIQSKKNGIGIDITYSNRNTYQKNEVKNSRVGMHFNSFIGSTVSENKIFNNIYGIYANAGFANNLSNNDLYANKVNIFLKDFVNNIIDHNNLNGNEIGIKLKHNIFQNTFSENTIESHNIGILVLDSFQNNIIGNNISHNNKGIMTVDFLSGTIFYNNIHDNRDFNLYNTYFLTIRADDNWWGTTNQTKIEEKIYDGLDNSTVGIVYYCPFLDSPYPGGNEISC